MKTNHYLRPFLLILFVLNTQGVFFSSGVLAQTQRYVAVGGSNNPNDCTDPNNPCGSVQYAHDTAAPGDIINIAAGEYTFNSTSLTLGKSITLQGAGNFDTFLQAHPQPGQASHRTVIIQPNPIDVVINDLTIRHGVAAGTGVPGRAGGLYYEFDTNNPGTLDLNNVRLIDNTARVGGGMFVTSNGAPELTTVSFQNNTATERGGGIYLYLNTAANLNNVAFNGNSAGVSGGAVYANASASNFSNCTFSANYASTGCSAIAFQSGSGGTVSGSGFFSHQTAGVGGAVCIDGGSNPMFNSVEFDSNESLGGRGGAVHIVNNSNPTFTEVHFSGNQSSGSNSDDGGGAVYIGANAHPEFHTVTFENNHSFGGGGGILAKDANLSLEDVMFLDNSADFAGGGLNFYGLSNFCGIRNGIFKGNTANVGGGFYNHQESGSFFNLVFTDNDAVTGGALYNYQNVTTYMRNATFSGNTANNGAAIFNNASSMHFIYNTVFWDNTATSQGHQLFNNSSSVATLHYSLIPGGGDNIVEGNGYTCNDCIDDDPLFVDAPNHHFQLSENSPAIDAGDPNTSEMGFPHNSSNEPIDILGNPRFVGTIDIGAYEWNSNLTINEVSETVLDVILYPNPASEKLHIESNQTIDQLVIYDFLGKVMAASFSTNGANTTTVDLSGFASGLYVLQLTIEDQTASYKVVKH